MAKNLVVLESPNKIKSVQKYLGNDYICLASYGHCIDLPPRKFGVDLKDNFKATYEVVSDKRHKDALKAILKEAKKSDVVYLLTDPDREGEAIAWHIANKLPKKVVYKRGCYNEITKSAVQEAIEKAGNIDEDRIAAYETRRILDRLVGYKCSYPVKMATGGISVGRTQSAGLRLLGERELEIINFKPDKYWDIQGTFSSNKDQFPVSIKKPKPLDINKESLAKKIVASFKKSVVVSKFEEKTSSRKPAPPFQTSSLLQAASTFLGMTPKRTMRAAQKLFEQGLITYHRTDSLKLAEKALGEIRSYLSSKFDAKYYPKQAIRYKTKSKHAQEGHEAIRPTNFFKNSVGGESDLKNLYALIWKRTVSCQMTATRSKVKSAEFKSGSYIMSAKGSEKVFDGFRAIWDYSKSEDSYLPTLKVGDSVDIQELKSFAKETRPPARYTEASCVKGLESSGIGRPSTYSSIIETLKARSYVEKDGRALKVTDLGLTVLKFLIQVKFCFSDLDFTSNLEDKLDEIATKKADKLETLSEFWDRLQKDLANCESERKKQRLTDHDCPECSSKLEKKFSKMGPFYGCSNYPDCKTIMNIGKNGDPVKKEKKKKKPVVLSDYDCPKCSEKMVEREGRYGKFYGCSKFPKCRGIRDGKGEVPKPKWQKKKKKKSK